MRKHRNCNETLSKKGEFESLFEHSKTGIITDVFGKDQTSLSRLDYLKCGKYFTPTGSIFWFEPASES